MQVLELSRRELTGTRLAQERGDFVWADAAAEAEGHVRQILHGFRRRDAARWRVRSALPEPEHEPSTENAEARTTGL